MQVVAAYVPTNCRLQTTKSQPQSVADGDEERKREEREGGRAIGARGNFEGHKGQCNAKDTQMDVHLGVRVCVCVCDIELKANNMAAFCSILVMITFANKPFLFIHTHTYVCIYVCMASKSLIIITHAYKVEENNSSF